MDVSPRSDLPAPARHVANRFNPYAPSRPPCHQFRGDFADRVALRPTKKGHAFRVPDDKLCRCFLPLTLPHHLMCNMCGFTAVRSRLRFSNARALFARWFSLSAGGT